MTLEAIREAEKLTLPDQDEIFTFTDYDRNIWQPAFDWYNKHINERKIPLTLNCRGCYAKVFMALYKAKI